MIADICRADQSEMMFTEEDIRKALARLNKGKAEDVFGVAVEHFLHAQDVCTPLVTKIMNTIVSLGAIPPVMKEGIITPVYKNKGSKYEAKNYRGITVTPVLTKILETLLGDEIEPYIQAAQNEMQRGFTKGASPLLCATIIEEVSRHSQDNKSPLYTAYLDAKAAFDVVNHNSLVRKLYATGIQGKPWQLIRDLHTNTNSAVKWKDEISKGFKIQQGVRQGGILSTTMYKVYINDLLNRLQRTSEGMKVGSIICSAPTCADDVTILAKDPIDLQTLLDATVSYSCRERYILQPTKSVILQVPASSRAKPLPAFEYFIGKNEVKIQKSTGHLGMVRDTRSSEAATVESNIQNARRRMYSLMKPGLHGENGLDPVTSIQLIRVFILPILLYALEVCIPTGIHLKKLESYLKRTLKQVLSLPVTTADPAVFILTGLLPMEAQIHLKALCHYGAITRQGKRSTEWRLANRQLSTKSTTSNSWFTQIKRFIMKYGLSDPLELLKCPTPAHKWKREVKLRISQYWKDRLILQASTYSSLAHLNYHIYTPGKPHPILETAPANPRDVTRLHTKIKLATGTYILQTNRKTFNQNRIRATCQLCNGEDETKQHFLTRCPGLSSYRDPILNDISPSMIQLSTFNPSLKQGHTNPEVLTQLIIDSSQLLGTFNPRDTSKDAVDTLNYHTRRLCYTLHSQRFKKLGLQPRRRKKKTH